MLKEILNRMRPGGVNSIPVSLQEPEAPDEPEEIPRYPSLQKGLPVASVERVLKTQWNLVRAVHQTLGLEHSQFQELILPVLVRYAAFVHLLPASERHHHRGAGGLFRHGLEVAYWAARASEGVVFVAGGTPLERKQLEQRWHVAVCLAGLVHDLGKPVCDLRVVDRDGSAQWDPYNETIVEWAQQHRVDRYFPHWCAPRHRHHELLSLSVADRVLTPGIKRWLHKPGPEILEAMYAAIMRSDPEDPVTQLVKSADEHSTAKDMQDRSHEEDQNPGVPVETHLLEAMRRLLASGEWTVNQRGARVWVTAHGLFIVWRHAAEQITRLLARQQVPGIPRDPNALAEILIGRDLAIPYVNPNGVRCPYWPVAPQLLAMADGAPVTLSMLRLAGAHLLFGVEPPAVVAALVGDLQETRAVVTPQPTASGPAPATAVIETPITAVATPAVAPARDLEPARPEATSSAATADARAVSEEALSRQGEAGRVLLAMARDVAADVRAWGEALARCGDHVLVRYPDGVLPYGEPAGVLDVLGKAGWLDLDPTAPFKKVRELNGVRGLVLADEPARYVLALAMAAADAPTAAPTPPHMTASGPDRGHDSR